MVYLHDVLCTVKTLLFTISYCTGTVQVTLLLVNILKRMHWNGTSQSVVVYSLQLRLSYYKSLSPKSINLLTSISSLSATVDGKKFAGIIAIVRG